MNITLEKAKNWSEQSTYTQRKLREQKVSESKIIPLLQQSKESGSNWIAYDFYREKPSRYISNWIGPGEVFVS